MRAGIPRDLSKVSDEALMRLIEKSMLDTATLARDGINVAPRPKTPLPTSELQTLLNEAKRRAIPMATLADFVVQRGFAADLRSGGCWRRRHGARSKSEQLPPLSPCSETTE
jgi:hypothetical protein